MSLFRSWPRLVNRLPKKPSIIDLSCGRCHHKIDTKEGMQLFLRRHMPDASVFARTSVGQVPWGTRKQVGIYDPGRISPPSRQVSAVLNGGKIGCPRCGAVEWRALR
ncbi:unnamed protein product [Effrenium voratum]|uniref:Uncharacterized protein n=1 Tax=Effrenium voratum TaxID=2562239 RepID=A0AA36JQU8_9DINO|nr:unnamed protein product [Effrenium voratum]CAJ1460580.1 unnamed protein product [Effrenium voratum]